MCSFQIIFNYRFLPDIDYSSLSCTVGLCLSVLHTVMCICWSQTPDLSLLLIPLVAIHLFSVSVSLFLFHKKSSFESFYFRVYISFPSGSVGKESACNAGDPGSIPGLGRSPGEGNGNPLQYSCLENPMDGGARPDTVHGIEKSQTRLCDLHIFLSLYKCYHTLLFLTYFT